MKTLTFAALIGALLLVPVAPSTARADDDDWEDYWEELEDDWDDDDDRRWRHGRRYRHYGYRPHYYYPERYYQRDYGRRTYYYDRPYGRRAYRYYDSYPRYYYGGHVHAGPADVYYGRHGEVRVGPFRFYW